MFTGIIQHLGAVTAVATTPAGRRLTIDLGPLAKDLAIGDSVAVDGACLTVAGLAGTAATFDVIGETLERTTLGERRAGDAVNLERALRAGAGLDGHIVQGHVDGTAREQRVDRAAGQWVVHFTGPRALTDDMAAKGSVAVDGVSLTLVDVADGLFSVALIPTTLERTTLGRRRPGHRVNVETDILAKYVRRMLGAAGRLSGRGELTLGKLREAGFE